MDIDKDKFIQVYGIDDDNFITYLNKFGTLKKIVNMDRLDVISKEKLNHLYNRYIYFNSLGHNLDTIVEETTPIIRNLFYFNGNGHFEYILPDDDGTLCSMNKSFVTISGRVCQVKINLSTKKELKNGDYLFSLIPAPVSEFRLNIPRNAGNLSFMIDDNGIEYDTKDNLQPPAYISASITYIFRK